MHLLGFCRPLQFIYKTIDSLVNIHVQYISLQFILCMEHFVLFYCVFLMHFYTQPHQKFCFWVNLILQLHRYSMKACHCFVWVLLILHFFTIFFVYGDNISTSNGLSQSLLSHFAQVGPIYNIYLGIKYVNND